MKLAQQISNAAALKRIQALLARIQSEATRFPDDPAAQRERIKRAKSDEMFFFTTYFPHWFESEFAEMHFALRDTLRIPGQKIVRYPRGFAKTTSAQGTLLYNSLFDRVKFQLVVGRNQDHGQEILLPVVMELEANPRLLQDFGDQTTEVWGWTNGFMLKNGCWLASEGWEGRIRGVKKGPYRPNFILVDDIEDEELVRNPRRVRRMIDWWLSEVMFALHDERGIAVWLCTSLSDRSPTSLLLDPEYSPHEGHDPPQFDRLSFRAENAERESTWPARFPTERLRAMEARMGSRAYRREMLHESVPDEGIFRREWFRKIAEDEIPQTELVSVTACDPSVKETTAADRKAVVTVSKHLPTGRYYIRHAWIRAATDTEMVEALYLQDRLYRPVVIRLETQGAFALLKYPLAEGAKRHGKVLHVRALTQSIPKEIRIRRVEPIAEQGRIYWVDQHSDQSELINQFEMFPASAAHDDGPDAAEMCIDYLESITAGGTMDGYASGERRTNFRQGF